MTESVDVQTQAFERCPRPWYVGERSSTRSMFPIRDANHRVVAYSHYYEVAQFIVEQAAAANHIMVHSP